MPVRTCPQCQRPGRLLEATSHVSSVEYFRCDACGHVWTYDKRNPDAPPRDVTERKAIRVLALRAIGRFGEGVKPGTTPNQYEVLGLQKGHEILIAQFGEVWKVLRIDRGITDGVWTGNF